MQKSSLSTFGFVLFSVAVPTAAGVLAALLAYLKDRKERKLTRTNIVFVGFESAVVALGGVFAVVLIAYLLFFIPTIYSLHISQARMITTLTANNLALRADVEDRKRNIRVAEPAYGHIKIIFSMYSDFRRIIGNNSPCQLRITAPSDSGTSSPIIRQLADPAGNAARCAAFGPTDMNMDPKEAQTALTGMEPGVLIIHTRNDQVGSLALYDALAPYLPVKRSFVMPKDSPQTLIWFQFGKDVKWHQ